MKYYVYYDYGYGEHGSAVFDTREKAGEWVQAHRAQGADCEVIYGRLMTIVPVEVVQKVRIEG